MNITDYDDDELNEEFAAKVSFEEDDKAKPKGSEEALDNALERTWYTDTSVSNPHNVGSAMGTEYEWMNWASYLANFPDQIATFWEEYDKDVKMHKYVLNKLSKEMSTKGDATEFIQALNCIFHDTFDRVRLEHPPLLNLERGMMMMNLNKMRGNFGQGGGGSERSLEPNHESHMKVWKGYENRAFKLMKTVQEHPLIPKPDPYEYIKDTTTKPLKNRGKFPTEDQRMKWEDEEDDGGCFGFSGADVEDLLAQGVKPWDDDAGAVLAAINGEYDY